MTDQVKRLRPLRSPNLGNKLRRLAWTLVDSTLYRWSPVPMHGWRCFLLRIFGAEIGRGAHPYPSARIWAPWNLKMAARSCLGPRVICYSVAPVSLGVDAIISQGAHLCSATHDHHSSTFPLVVGDIVIGDRAWIAADAFVGPGVTIANRAVAGARAVVMQDVPEAAVVVGNPARVVGVRDERDPAKAGAPTNRRSLTASG